MGTQTGANKLLWLLLCKLGRSDFLFRFSDSECLEDIQRAGAMKLTSPAAAPRGDSQCWPRSRGVVRGVQPAGRAHNSRVSNQEGFRAAGAKACTEHELPPGVTPDGQGGCSDGLLRSVCPPADGAGGAFTYSRPGNLGSLKGYFKSFVSASAFRGPHLHGSAPSALTSRPFSHSQQGQGCTAGAQGTEQHMDQAEEARGGRRGHLRGGLQLRVGMAVSQPGVPGGVHAAQVVQAVGGGHQRVHLALPTFKLGEVVQAGHDGGDSFLHQGDQLLTVHVLWLPSGRERRRGVLLRLFVPSDDLIPKHSLQDAVHLCEERETLAFKHE